MATSPAGPARASHMPRTLGLALGLAFSVATASADEPSRAKGPLESDPPASRVVLAGANRDTLAYARRDIVPVAIAALESDGWTIQRTDTTSGRIVTHWKPLKHVLARLLLGQVMGRCVVDLVPQPDGRTLVTIQGGLASDQDLERNAAFGTAQAVYHSAAVKWLNEVRAGLDERARQGLVARVERGPARQLN